MGMQEQSGSGGLDVFRIASGLGRAGQALAKSQDRSDAAEARTRAAELAAEDQARRERTQARQEADKARSQSQRQRSKALTLAGASGVTLSGSPAAVLRGRTVEDEKEYQSVLSTGLDKAEQTLSQGRVRAAQARSASDTDWYRTGLGLAGSLIANGSSLYGS